MRRTLIFTIMMAGSFTVAGAQTPSLQQQAPNMPPLERMPPEKIEPADPSSTGSTDTLSDKLQETEGVIRPPVTSTPDMRVPAPEPNPGTTPVIPPPGSPGGNQNVQPR
ncbi:MULTISPECIES: hypothetical protein [Microvirga]|uniref:hypothetical protein n=1 Tax=Microvirga TaxID=186650 RepID=UPI001CFCED72|nr:hypothetical protein [Microvirga lenta]MCB5173936.1 hypothetical protein [Microvirga lenta]